MNLANCADFDLPITDFDDCNPEINFSEIERIFLGGPKAAAFADIQAAGEWTGRLSQTTTGPNVIRGLTVIADKPAAASVIRDISNGRRKPIGKDHTLAFTIDDISDANYEFYKTLENNTTVRLFAFETQGGKMYAPNGNEGQLVNVDLNVILARGRDEIERIDGTLTWRRLTSGDRFDSPIFEGEGGGATAYDSDIVFNVATADAEDSVSGTAPAINANLKLEFNGIAAPVGAPASMDIKVDGVSKLVVDFPNDYLADPFKFTNTDGAIYNGVFTDGEVNF